MTPERYRQIGELYHATLEVEAEERSAFLERACAGDEELRREVESLVASHEQSADFIATPALAVAAGLIAQRDSLVGQIVAHYRVLSLVGEGGMGEVYLAEDTRLGRRVALKLLPAAFTNDADRMRRFMQEARAASALNHPNILTVHEIGRVNGLEFIATEFIEGETLRPSMAKRRLKLAQALDVAAQVAGALAAAHAAGVVHRDIKPENIMLRPDGYVKVLDFGLAKLAGQGLKTGNEASTVTRVETNPGVVMGTVQYMSPEQARGLPVDARTDVWSLGVVLYEMIAGRPPFEGKTQSDTIVTILEREPAPLEQHAPEGSAELERIVTKALTKDRDERYQTVKDMAIDLRRLRRRLDVDAEIERSLASKDDAIDIGHGDLHPAQRTDAQSALRVSQVDPARTTSSVEYVVSEITRHKRGTALFGAILILVLGGVGYGIYRLLNQPNSAAPSQVTKVTRLTSNGTTKLAAVSPDGKFLAYVLDEARQQSLWLRNIATGSNVQVLPPLENALLGGLTFSPDGNHIYYIVDTTLYQLPVLGGASKKVLQNIVGASSSHGITFSPDRMQFAFKRAFSETNQTAIIIVNADGGNERTLVSVKRPLSLVSPPAWSPNGKVIAVSALTASGKQEVLAVQVADGVVASIPSPFWYFVAQVVWLPDSTGLFVISEGDGTSLQKIRYLSYPSGNSHIVSNDSNAYNSISLSADGRSLVATRSDQEAHIWVVPNDDTSQGRQLTSGFEKYDGASGIDWLPDNRIIYQSDPTGESEVWAVKTDGGSPQQLLHGHGVSRASPDGRYILTQGGGAEGLGLFRVDLKDGSEKRLTHGTDLYGSFSVDGEWVVYTRYSEQVAVWKVPIEGGEALKLTNVSGATLAPMISPDGKFVAFIWRSSQQGGSSSAITLISFDGGEIIKTFAVPIQPLIGRGREPLQWTADGQAVNYVSFQNGASNMWRQPIDGSPPVQVTNFRDGRIFNFAYSSDEKQLALSRGTFNRDVILISDPQ